MKKMKRIENIESSKLFKEIVKKKNQDNVKVWEFRISMTEVEFTEPDFRKIKNHSSFKRVIRGKNEIQWSVLQEEINKVNERYNKLKTKNNVITFVDLNRIFDEFATCVLTGTIILENGDFITIDEEYHSYEDSYALEVTRHTIPRIEVNDDIEILDLSKERDDTPLLQEAINDVIIELDKQYRQ